MLERGMRFTPSPKSILKMDIVAKIEEAFSTHENKGRAETARAALANVIRNAKPPTSNVRKSEWKAVANLREDVSIVVLEADKGNATVGMDVADYNEKALEVIANTRLSS